MRKLGTLTAALIVVLGLWWLNILPGIWDIQHAGEDVNAINAAQRAEHRVARLATFAVDKAPPGAVLFFGSSTIERLPFSFLFPGAPTVNRGVGNEESALLRKRIASAVEPATWPTVAGVVLYAGSLDRIRLNSPPANIAANATAIIRELRSLAPEAEILVLGLLPQRDITAGAIEALAETNQALAAVAQVNAATTFLDLNRAPLRIPSGQLSEAYSVDRFHLNGDGYQVLGQWVRQEGGAIAALLFP